jgi:hypothetical protein
MKNESEIDARFERLDEAIKNFKEFLAAKPEFKMCGTGVYEMRNGKKSYIHSVAGNDRNFPFKGFCKLDEGAYERESWRENGRITVCSESPYDIVKKLENYYD